jgi:1,4-dihydroxy-2-naphthoate polyprenyltransferase
MGKIRVWLLAARPKTLAAGVVPVIVGTAVAHVTGGVVWSQAVLALLFASCIQVGTNFVNDLCDFERGADTGDRLGPTRVIQAGLLSKTEIRLGVVLVFVLAAMSGVVLAIRSAPFLGLGIVAMSILCGFAYTAGPFPLAYLGIAEAFVFFFFGTVATVGTTYSQTGNWSPLAFGLSVPVGALSTAILVVNNVRDRVQDVQAGKRTMVVRFGRRFGVVEYGVLLALAFLAPALLVGLRVESAWILLPCVLVPVACLRFWEVARTDGERLNRTLADTAKLLVGHSVLTVIGLLLGPMA